LKREAPGRLFRIAGPLVAGSERGLNPEETEVLTDMEKWTRVRVRMAQEEISKRELCRQEEIAYKTLQKILTHPSPPGYPKRPDRPRPKVGPHLDRIFQILLDDRSVPKKQRHTAKRIFERLRDEEGYTGGYTQVKEAVRELRPQVGESHIPLQHDPGEAQVDIGQALVKRGGAFHKVHFFVMGLPYSGALYVQAFERSCTETFLEFMKRAFEYFGGVPRRITFDNEKMFVAKITGPRERVLTPAFLELQSHYRFVEHFCRVRRPMEKGVVEANVKLARARFFVPVPEVDDLGAFNTRLVEYCDLDLKRRLRGRASCKAELLDKERPVFLPLPEDPFDACRKVCAQADSRSLVRFRTNDYSIPTRYAHQLVLVKGYVDRVEIYKHSQLIACHRRCWDREQMILDPVHYLALLERKPGALDHGQPFVNWQLPGCFAVLRARLENELSGEGTREYIRVLRLLEKHPLAEVTRAIERSLRCGALIRDAIAQFLEPPQEWRESLFRLAGREYLRHVKIDCVDVATYGELLPAGGGS
jgi:transposase